MTLKQMCLSCPYCGEPFELFLEPSEAAQRYVEDCSVCCRPVDVNIHPSGRNDSVEVILLRDDE